MEKNKLEFNKLSKEERMELFKPYFINPFTDITENHKMYNPFTFDVITMKGKGVWDNGTHFMHNPWDFKLYRKIIVENNKVTKVFIVNETDDDFIEIKPHEDGTWDASCFE